MIPNLNRSEVRQILDRIRRLERANPLSNSSLGRGRMRFYDGSVLLIENGALNVTGSATITGTLNSNGIFNGSGTNNLDGVNNLSGENHFTGPTDVAGDFEIIEGGLFKAGESVINPDGSATFGLFDIAANGDLKSKGALSIEGPTVLKNDLTVDAGKKIKLGGLTLENQGIDSAEVQMPGGGLSSSTLLGMLLVHDSVIIGGATMVKIDTPNLKGKLPTRAGVAGNIYCDPATDQWFRAI